MRIVILYYHSLSLSSDDAEILVCTMEGRLNDPVISYDECTGSSIRMNEAIDRQTGIFVAPEDGNYEVSFTGHLKSYNGRRVWATLYKLDKDETGYEVVHW